MKHVLLLSIDGMQALDFINCAAGISGVNRGAPYCPNLAKLAETGVNYLEAATSKLSDSFPGLMALMRGGSPRSVGAFYDDSYDRSLDPPAKTTGNGLHGAPGLCKPRTAPTGTSTEFDEGIDIDKTLLNGGAPDRRGRRHQVHRSDRARAQSREKLCPGLSMELRSHQHDFWRGAWGASLHGLVGQASVLFVGLGSRGGFSHDDTNVMMLLSNPHFSTNTITGPVETMQIAPTVLLALGLNPEALQCVQQEGTQVLPEVPF
jgi:Type I phosphodiesterase / nucleotide pyrophosphatase